MLSGMSQLSVDLEAALLRALKDAYRDLNYGLFKGRLQPAQLELSDAGSRLGQWQRDTRTIELGRTFASTAGWGEVLEVLKHEMAHQYTAEILGDPDPTPHGPAFQALCDKLGIDGRAAGRPTSSADAPSTVRPSEGEEDAAPRVLQRIAKLLALAGSANQHEAELAMNEAQRLMLAYNIERAASHHYRFVHLGVPTGRVSEAERTLANVLGEHFFVEVIWVPVWRAQEGRRGSVLEVCGAPANLEMAGYVYDFLLRTANRLWDEHRRAQRIRSQRDRRTFVAGVIAGFKEKLDRQRTAHQSRGLVWIGDADLTKYFRRRHPRIRWTSYQSSTASTAHAEGRAAGRELTLHRPLASSAKAGAGPRLLQSGR